MIIRSGIRINLFPCLAGVTWSSFPTLHGMHCPQTPDPTTPSLARRHCRERRHGHHDFSTLRGQHGSA